MPAYSLGAQDRTVAFLNHVDVSRNFDQVIILRYKLTRGTQVYEKEKHAYKYRLSRLYPCIYDQTFPLAEGGVWGRDSAPATTASNTPPTHSISGVISEEASRLR